MQKRARNRSSSQRIARVLGLSIIGTFIFTAIVALRHMLETPMRLVSPLPGESHYYKWKCGYIFYKVLGAPEAPPLLLLHTPELAASAYEMRKILEPLAQHYRVYAPDLIGFGFSDHPTIDYTADTYLTLCRDFLTSVVKQPATLVASRISCNYAVGTAATSPDLCERLVLISPVALAGRQARVSLLPALTARSPFMQVWPRLLQSAPAKWLLYPMLSTRFALRSVMGSVTGMPVNCACAVKFRRVVVLAPHALAKVTTTVVWIAGIACSSVTRALRGGLNNRSAAPTKAVPQAGSARRPPCRAGFSLSAARGGVDPLVQATRRSSGPSPR